MTTCSPDEAKLAMLTKCQFQLTIDVADVEQTPVIGCSSLQKQSRSLETVEDVEMDDKSPDFLISSRSLSRSPPRFLFLIVLWLGSFLQKVLDIIIPPPQRVLQKSLAFVDSHIIFTANKLGVADALGDGSASVEELAREMGDFPSFPLCASTFPVLFWQSATSVLLHDLAPQSFMRGLRLRPACLGREILIDFCPGIALQCIAAESEM